MPIDKINNTTIVSIVPHETKRKLKKLAKKYHRTVSSHIAYLVEKAIEEDKNNSDNSES